MADCIFCKIVQGEIPADVVYTDAEVVGFRDINPQAPVHIVLIPRVHVENLSAVDESHGEVLAGLCLAAGKIAQAEGIADSGYRVVTNAGPAAGQSVDHLHLHILGGRSMGWPPG
jgi:histidine triad (HIT) family protein